MSDSALVQELAITRAALRDAIRLGETLAARIDAACMMLAERADTTDVRDIIATLKGES